LREIFKDRKLLFVKGSWVQCLNRLKKGDIDLMVSIAYTTDRAKLYDFNIEPVLSIWGQAFARPGDPIESIRDLENKTVAVMEKDINGKNFISTATALGIAFTIIERPTHDDVFEAVRTGKANAGIAPQHFGLRKCQQYGLIPTSIVFSPFPVYFAVQKGHNGDLLNRIDQELVQWKKDKSSFYYECVAFWIGDTKFKRRFIPNWLLWLIGSVTAIAIALIILNRWLNIKVKQQTRELRAKEREYRDLVESANSVILRWDLDGRCRFMNKFGLDLFGFSREEISEKGFIEKIVPQNNTIENDEPSLIQQIIDDPESFRLNENENICKDGRRVFIQWSNRTIYDEQGNFVEMLSIGTDISQRKQLEADLFHSRKMEAVGTLAGGIAHDFNNILSIIFGYTELLLINENEGTPQHDYIEQLLEAAKRARDLVSQILAFSRKTGVPQKVFQLSPVIIDALVMIRSTFPATIRIEQSFQKDFLVYGSTSQIQQVIMNLCTNAYHAMEAEGGTLSVSTAKYTGNPEATPPDTEAEDYACIEVKDTGPGIPDPIRENIFEPYFTTKEQGKGTGLGLAVAHGIIKDHNGYISVESEHGQGTLFKIFLPIVDDSIPEATTLPKSHKLFEGTESLILVDDERAIVDSVTQILESKGYRITGFTRSTDALDHFMKHPDRYRLMITDMTMPDLTGDQLAIQVLDLCPGFPIILCTGYSDRITPEKAAAMGIKGYTSKPLVSEELLCMIRDLLDNHR
jgi:PAS domain S-box-containing protein